METLKDKKILESTQEMNPDINQEISFKINKEFFIASMSLVGITGFAIFAYHTNEWSILLIAGLALFLRFYPLAKGTSQSFRENIKRELSLLALIAVVSCVVLIFLIDEPRDYAKYVVLIMAAVGIKLVFYPVYGDD